MSAVDCLLQFRFFLSIFTMMALLLPCSISAQKLSAIEEKIINHVNEHSEDAIAFLERIVNVNSGTMNHEGVRTVGQIFQKELDALGFATRWIPMPDSVNRAGHLFAERKGNKGKRLLLIGHLDTVFEIDSPFQRFTRNDSVAYGPGVNDMKGGDVAQNLPGTSSEITFTDSYPAMPPTNGNYQLLKILDQISRDLEYGAVEALDPGRRGASDISFIASFVDGLAGIGVLGEGAHTAGENLDLHSLPILTKRTALLINRLVE